MVSVKYYLFSVLSCINWVSNALHSQPKKETPVEHKKAIVSVPNSNGANQLHFASYLGRLSVVKSLLATANLDLRTKKNSDFDLGKNLKNDRGGATALMLACYSGHYAIVQALLELCSEHEINAQDDRGHTALHYVILSDAHWPYKPLDENKKHIIRLLLQAKANPCLCDEVGNDALYYYSVLAALIPGPGPQGYITDPSTREQDKIYQLMLKLAQGKS